MLRYYDGNQYNRLTLYRTAIKHEHYTLATVIKGRPDIDKVCLPIVSTPYIKRGHSFVMQRANTLNYATTH